MCGIITFRSRNKYCQKKTQQNYFHIWSAVVSESQTKTTNCTANFFPNNFVIMITCDRCQAFRFSSVRNLGKLHITDYTCIPLTYESKISFTWEQFSTKSFISITVCVANYLSFNKTRHFPGQK